MVESRARFAALTAFVATLSACAPQSKASLHAGPVPLPAPPAETSPAAIAKAQADSARLPYTAADIHFMTGMISHHAQAIRMAGWVPSRAAHPSLRILAERIINAQTDEIHLMQQWLRDRRQPVPEPSPTGMRMTHDGVVHEMLMPGMLTPEQMARLEAAQGAEFDQLFLTFMIQHHQGATAMVAELFSQDGAGQDEIVFKFASDVNVDQTTEIARMERMLASLQGPRRAP